MRRQAIPLLAGCVCLLAQARTWGQARQYFRILGTNPTAITRIEASGFVTWSNATPGVTCIVEVASSLTESNAWRPYAQIPVTATVMRARLFDLHPPQGMSLVPAGCFQMGDSMDPPDSNESELPVHTVYMHEFYMDQCGVTKEQWDDVCHWATNRPTDLAYQFDHAGTSTGPNHPVTTVSWYDIVKWCNARSEKEGLTPAYYTSADMTNAYRTGWVDVSNDWVAWKSDGYRIPTEAEQEKAARGGLIGRRFPLGDTISYFEANFMSVGESYDTSPARGPNPMYPVGSAPVGSYPPNGYGLYDMAGNGLQWNWDWYDFGWYTAAAATQTDTPGPPSGTYRMARGGCWARGAWYIRCSCRVGLGGLSPNAADVYYGFRCVRCVL